jgi:hypothetical protein
MFPKEQRAATPQYDSVFPRVFHPRTFSVKRPPKGVHADQAIVAEHAGAENLVKCDLFVVRFDHAVRFWLYQRAGV